MPGLSVLRKTRLSIVALLMGPLIVLLGADSCPGGAWRNLIRTLRTEMETTQWGEIHIDRLPGLRVHIYPAPPASLPEGTIVEEYLPIPPEEPTRLECESDSGCWLVFIDTDHWAHFSHKVVIALWERDDNRFQGPIIAGWWPLVNGTPVFDTVASRETVFLEELSARRGLVADARLRWGETRWDVLPTPTPTPTPTPVPRLWLSPPETPEPPLADTCPAWAVIVNGFKDEDDTFDEDTDGMYAVLTAHDVPPDHIYYLTALHEEEPCDEPTVLPSYEFPYPEDACPEPPASECPTEDQLLQPASFCNLRRVFKEYLPARIEASDAGCEDLLFFLSTHGAPCVMRCGPDVMIYRDLKELLWDINCDNITVVVEACYSGGLVDLIADPSPAVARQHRFVFTSTSQNGESHRDIDWLVGPPTVSEWTADPNPGDTGSETVWGYIEAFATGAADTVSANQRISFAEAVEYAIGNDVMTINGLNSPIVTPTPAPDRDAHTCATPPTNADAMITIARSTPQESSTTDATAPSTIVSMGETLSLSLSVRNLENGESSDDVTAAAVKVYWAPANGAEWPKSFFDHSTTSYFDRQIGDTVILTGIDVGASRELELEWKVPKKSELEGQIMLLAVVDSPQDPISFDQKGAVELEEESNNFSILTLNVVPGNKRWCPLGCRTAH